LRQRPRTLKSLIWARIAPSSRVPVRPGVCRNASWGGCTPPAVHALPLPDEAIQQRLPLSPRPEPGCAVDVPLLADVDELAPPKPGEFGGPRHSHVLVVGAGDHHARKRESVVWNRREADRPRWIDGAPRRSPDEQRGPIPWPTPADPPMSPVATVTHPRLCAASHDRARRIRRTLERRYPILAVRRLPIQLLHRRQSARSRSQYDCQCSDLNSRAPAPRAPVPRRTFDMSRPLIRLDRQTCVVLPPHEPPTRGRTAVTHCGQCRSRR